MFGAFAAGFGLGGGTFAASYRVYPVSFLDRPDAEAGDKLFLPPSALDRLASLHIEYPMLFKVDNRAASRSTHCGVLEFVADEGVAYMPYWMMQNLALGEGDVVHIASASLPKGTFTKLRPHTSDFLNISNPRAVLERTLRGYSCLTTGDCICLHYNAKRYYIDVVETRPGDAVSVIETDCEVDFAPPLDAPPSPPPAPAAAASAPMEVADEGAAPAAADAAAADAPPAEPAFVPFLGAGRRLDGKPGPSSTAPVPVPAADKAAAAPASASGSAPRGSAPGGRAAGTVVFGGGNRLLAKQQAAAKSPGAPAAAPAPTLAPAAEPAPEEPSFQAFTGKARSLRD